MAFFGLPNRELPRNGLDDVSDGAWNEKYDGLGDALQEGGDELNDETFGSAGPVGRDFDFASTAFHQDDELAQLPARQAPEHLRDQPQRRVEQRNEPELPQVRHSQTQRSTIAGNSLESIWDDHSAFSPLSRQTPVNRAVGQQQRAPTAGIQPQSHAPGQRFSPFGNTSPVISHAQQQPQVRTLQDVEQELLLRAELERREREEEVRQQRLLLLQQQQRDPLLQAQLLEEERRPRMRQEQRTQSAQMQQLYMQQPDQQRLLQQQEQLRLLQQQEQQRLLQQQQQQEQARILQQQEQQRLLQQQQQEQQYQAQVQRLLLHAQQVRDQLQQQRTPPPRMMPPSQSPRFLEHQRQILLLQQQQEQQQKQRLLEIQEQLRMEELERRMSTQMSLEARNGSPFSARRTPAGYSNAELQAAQLAQQQLEQQQAVLQQQQHRRQSSRSPAIGVGSQHMQDGPHHAQQTLQLQQRLLSDLAQVDFGREHGISPADQEALRMEAMRKIVETEKMEEKRRRKAAKIAHMARYNDLMTQSDKDFITRIQVSQLVTQDPYADDFYAQVYGAILRSRLGLQSQDERVIKFGSGGGIGLGLASKGGNRRPSAMQRMEQQVERIVSNARKREEEKGLHAIHSLQGALGKTSGRSYKAAPRQLLQVEAGPSASPTLSHAHAHISKPSQHGAAQEAAKLGREALGNAADTDGLVRKEPLAHRQVLVILEDLYDMVLRVEQLRRDQPVPEDIEGTERWTNEYDKLVDELWNELRVMEPLETSDPHPFISLLAPAKGKKILPRLTRHLSSQRMLTLLTLLVACFSQLDVIKQAPILDTVEETGERSDVDRQTQAFLGSVMQSILPVVSVANLRLVTGLLGLLLDRSDIVAVAQTKPGLALLTLFLSRVEVIKQTVASNVEMTEPPPTLEESQQWRLMFDHLFQLLSPHLITLFPSSRIMGSAPANHPIPSDIVDQPVWQFLAALALHGVIEQHHVLVVSLREKILDNVLSVNKGWVHDEDERQTKLANVNLFLHAVNLDSSQIAL